MSHRFQNSIYNLEKFPVTLWAQATATDWDASGYATTDTKVAAKSLGVDYIYRTGAGVFKIGLKKTYNTVLFVDAQVISADSSISSVDVTTDDVDGSSPYVTVTLRDHAGTAADPPDSATVLFRIELRNSTAG